MTEFVSLATSAHLPCSLISFNDLTIVVDCPLDFSPLQFFLPLPVVPSSCQKVHDATPVSGSAASIAKQLNGLAYFDALPEVLAPQLSNISWRDVDLILISNYQTLAALPYITRDDDFMGLILATEPVVELGRFFVQELQMYISELRDTPAHLDPTLKNFTTPGDLPPGLKNVAGMEHWRVMYSAEDLEQSLERVEHCFYTHSTDVLGQVVVTSYSAGHSIGSCNWLLDSGCEKLGVLSHCCAFSTHPQSLHIEPFKDVDILLLSTVNSQPLVSPNQMSDQFCIQVTQTLRQGGNVIIPCEPVGLAYDLMECLAIYLDNCSLTNIPFYFISPMAKNSLAVSNLYVDWLSNSKQRRLDLMVNPFVHSEMLDSGRLKHFTGIYDGFGADFQQPCVVFCGHTSARLGPVTHLLDIWGEASKHMLVFTHPRVDSALALAPFQPLSVRTASFPIDTTLSLAQAATLVRDISPKHLVIPSNIILEARNADISFTNGGKCQVHSLLNNRAITIQTSSNMAAIELTADLAESLYPMELPSGQSVAVCSAEVRHIAGRYQLHPTSAELPTCYAVEAPNVHDLVSRLKEAGFADVKLEEVDDRYVIYLEEGDALLQIEGNSTHIISSLDDSKRMKVKNALLKCLPLIQ